MSELQKDPPVDSPAEAPRKVPRRARLIFSTGCVTGDRMLVDNLMLRMPSTGCATSDHRTRDQLMAALHGDGIEIFDKNE